MAFHNAYNFVPIPKRPGTGSGNPLADHAPAGHGVLPAGLYSGTLRVRLTTLTRLLIAERPAQSAGAAAGFDSTLRLRSRSGRPDGPIAGSDVEIPVTSVKGALRSAYEAATNSRFGVFDQLAHRRPLGFRQQAQEGTTVCPVRLDRAGDGWIATVYDLELDTASYPCLPREPDRNQHLHPLAAPDGSVPTLPEVVQRCFEPYANGARVAVAVVPVVRTRDNNSYAHKQVVGVGGPGTTPQDVLRVEGAGRRVRPAERTVREGYVYRTGLTIGSKHDERVFLDPEEGVVVLTVSGNHLEEFGLLLDDYLRVLAANLLHDRRAWPLANAPVRRRLAYLLGTDPASPALPPVAELRRLQDQLEQGAISPFEPTEGELAWARIKDGEIVGLQPVMIGRQLSELAPLQLLRGDLRPAAALAEFSPADRVFGQVEQVASDATGRGERGAGAAYRGHLQIGPIEPREVELVSTPARLPVLASPKPSQARFYGARDNVGTPYPDGLARAAMYQGAGGLRGRKTYIRQRDALVADGPVTVASHVAPDSTFAFDVTVTNLSAAELGALLWLLSPEELRADDGPDGAVPALLLGHAKPYGWGACSFEFDAAESRIELNEAWSAVYRDLTGCLGLRSGGAALETLAAFKDSSVAAHAEASELDPVPFDELPHIRALRRAATGYGSDQVSYPGGTGVAGAANAQPVLGWFRKNEGVTLVRQRPYREGIALPLLGSSIERLLPNTPGGH